MRGPRGRAVAPPSRRGCPGHGPFMKRSSRGKAKPAAKKTSGRREGGFAHAREAGPHGWLSPLREASYARLVPRDAPETETSVPDTTAPAEPARPAKAAKAS